MYSRILALFPGHAHNWEWSPFINCMYICQAIKKAVSLSSQDHTHWNVLGIIAAQPGELNLSHYLSHSHPLPSISSATAVAICMCGVFFFVAQE